MREILFRGRRLDNGEWVEGYGVVQNIELGDACIIHRQGQNIMQHTAVDPATVGQWTGLVDQDGVRIFEGDLAEYYGCNAYAVTIEQTHGLRAKLGLDLFTSADAQNCRVIGTIHDMEVINEF